MFANGPMFESCRASPVCRGRKESSNRESEPHQEVTVPSGGGSIRVVGPRCSVDEDGCVGSPCNTTAACQDLTPSVQQSRGLTYQCSSCSVGYTLSSSLKCTGNFCALFEDAKMRLKNTSCNIYMIFVFNTLDFNILFKFCRC